MPRSTIAQARDAVAARLLLLDIDGQPELVASIDAALGDTQRMLAMVEPWLVPLYRHTADVVAGRAWYPLPGPWEGMVAIAVQRAGRTDLLPIGLVLEDLSRTEGGEARAGLRVTSTVASVTVVAGGTGYTVGQALAIADPGGLGWGATAVVATVDGNGAILTVTVTEGGGGYILAPSVTVVGSGSGASLTATLADRDCLLLSPTPAQSGTLIIEWRAVPAAFPTENDRLVMDDLLVVLTTAAAIAPATSSPRASTIAGEASACLQALRRRSAPAAGKSFGFGSGRR